MRGRIIAAAFLCLSLGRATSGAQTLVGSVRVYGSEPHTYVAIVSEADGRVYAVEGPKAEDLRRLQGQRLEFTVKILPQKPAYPPGLDGAAELISWKAAE
ncbi:MAG: hypothetical protein LBR23_03045 [Spirochaetaceae bacterium]|jgi:hypothetical protein|nr:hypothetical protein [Spirochaetaceae bacterium]